MSEIPLKDYFTPFDHQNFEYPKIFNKEELMFSKVSFLSEISDNIFSGDYNLAIIGVEEDRNSDNKGTAKAPDVVRNELYKLYAPSELKIVDFGNLKKGKNVKDTYSALTEIVYECLRKEIAVIIIGGSKDLTVPVTTAYKKGKKHFNLCVIDSLFNLGDDSELITSDGYLSNIISKNKKLFNFTNIGYQTYYNSNEEIELIKSEYEAVRLGIARTDLFGNEPYIRDADFVSFNAGSLKMTDMPGFVNAPVHGFYGEEACQLAKYAGLSDKVSVFGIFDFNPDYDVRNQSAALYAQVIWHFIESFYKRKNETDTVILKNYKQYQVKVTGLPDDMIFYQSMKTNRWWVEIPYHIKDKEKKYLLSCIKDDYLKAGKNEIPERWWKFYKKLN